MRRSIQVVVMQVDLVACIDLYVFELVRFALLFRLFCLWILASGYWWVEFLDMLRCLFRWFVN